MTLGEDAGIRCRLDVLLAERGMTLTELSRLVGISIVNLSVLKNDRAKAIRFSTLESICRVLRCDVGELLAVADAGGDGELRTHDDDVWRARIDADRYGQPKTRTSQ